jgi:hypothetical protein
MHLIPFIENIYEKLFFGQQPNESRINIEFSNMNLNVFEANEKGRLLLVNDTNLTLYSRIDRQQEIQLRIKLNRSDCSFRRDVSSIEDIHFN